jgi:hypothetical protein
MGVRRRLPLYLQHIVLLSKLIVAQLLKKLPAFYASRNYINVFTKPANGP